MKVAQSCLTLCDPMDYTVFGILHARILEWVAILLTGSSVRGILQARILERLPFPPQGDFPNPGIKPRSSTLQVNSLSAEPPGKPGKVNV